jgi:WD40 repeat protein
MDSKQRSRGVVLTAIGRQKLKKTISEIYFDKRATQEELSGITTLNPSTLAKVDAGQIGVDKRTLKIYFEAFSLNLEVEDYEACGRLSKTEDSLTFDIDENTIPSIEDFVGRLEEQKNLRQMIFDDNCNLIAITGSGGIGKSSLVATVSKFFDELNESDYRYIICRTLQDAPSFKSIGIDILKSIQNLQNSEIQDDIVNQLVSALATIKCLIIFDNAESVFNKLKKPHQVDLDENYQIFFDLIAEAKTFRSCIIFTSRELPESLESPNKSGIGKILLSGVSDKEAAAIAENSGLEKFSEHEIRLLNQAYSGNPFALKMVAQTIFSAYLGNVSSFMEKNRLLNKPIQELVDSQFKESSKIERVIIIWLSVCREPIKIESLELLLDNMLSSSSEDEDLTTSDIIQSLLRKSLIEKRASGFTLQPIVMEFAVKNFVEQCVKEIDQQRFSFFHTNGLTTLFSEDHIRETQLQLIVKKIISGLKKIWNINEKGVADKIIKIIASVRESEEIFLKEGYIIGNILNILLVMNTRLENLDLSGLYIRQVDFQKHFLRDINFSHSNLESCTFSENFSCILSVAWSSNSSLLATGDASGTIHIRQAPSGKTILTRQAHENRVRVLCFSHNGEFLASASDDKTVALWETNTGRLIHRFDVHDDRIRALSFHSSSSLNILAAGSDDGSISIWRLSLSKNNISGTIDEHHTIENLSPVRAVAISPDGNYLATSANCNIKIWNISTNKLIQEFEAHKEWIWTLNFNPNGDLLASAGDDNIIHLWDTHSWQRKSTFTGHTSWISSVLFSPDPSDQRLASSSADFTIRIWDCQSEKCLRILEGHNNWVWSVAFSPDGNYILSGGDDQSIIIWDSTHGYCLREIQGFTNWVWSVDFSPDGQSIACGSEDGTVRIWDVRTKRRITSIHAHEKRIWCVTFSSDNKMLASCSDDKTIRIWDLESSQSYRNWHGSAKHLDRVRAIEFSPNSSILASGGDDNKIKIWNIKTGKLEKEISAHKSWIWSLEFTPDGDFLISGSEDGTVKVWNVQSWECVSTLNHDSSVLSISCHPDNTRLVSAGDDCVIKIWDLQTEACIGILSEHRDRVRSTTFSANGSLLASSSEDKKIILWDFNLMASIQYFQGHTSRVRSVAASTDNQTFASCGEDNTLNIWDSKKSRGKELITSLEPDMLYDGINIRGAYGLTEAQRRNLIDLGAIEE